ncbi:MAG: DUF4198 domain-containing protein [Pseudomonadota bacterium]
MTHFHPVHRLLLAVWCVILPGYATAHEFWIAPEPYMVQSGDNLVARLINGEDFAGVGLSYIERRIARFEVIHNGTAQKVTARMGDNPALDIDAPGDGLVVVVHETTPSIITYKTWEKFQKFADHKDFSDWRARHNALGFPEPPFKERYTRHAKALMAVGNGAGSDAATGMKTEFVALTNPYAPGFDGQMRVRVLLDGAPRADVQVEVFDRAAPDDVTITLHRTDTNGVATIPVTRGHDYLFDAVTLAPISDSDRASWDTYWAALTFTVP